MSGRALLFVGRLPMDVRERDLEKVFEKYGRLIRCDVKCGMYTYLSTNVSTDVLCAPGYLIGAKKALLCLLW